MRGDYQVRSLFSIVECYSCLPRFLVNVQHFHFATSFFPFGNHSSLFGKLVQSNSEKREKGRKEGNKGEACPDKEWKSHRLSLTCCAEKFLKTSADTISVESIL